LFGDATTSFNNLHKIPKKDKKIFMNDKEFLSDMNKWPNSSFGHYCCLKNSKTKELGFILEIDNPNGMSGDIVLSLGNIFNEGTGETRNYKSLDDLLEEGWWVD
jgi:hypothetical protein